MDFRKKWSAVLCLPCYMILFEAHQRLNVTVNVTERSAQLLNILQQLLVAGNARTHRDVAWYADQLNVSPKHLGELVKHHTGDTLTNLINQYAVPELTKLLAMTDIPLSQVANLMRFESMSYFTRYVKKHLNMTPSKYRLSLRPK